MRGKWFILGWVMLSVGQHSVGQSNVIYAPPLQKQTFNYRGNATVFKVIKPFEYEHNFLLLNKSRRVIDTNQVISLSKIPRKEFHVEGFWVNPISIRVWQPHPYKPNKIVFAQTFKYSSFTITPSIQQKLLKNEPIIIEILEAVDRRTGYKVTLIHNKIHIRLKD